MPNSSSQKKTWIPSKCAYLAGLLITLIKKPSLKASISVNGEPETTCRYLLTTYANGAFCGGGFHSNPKSSLNDGKIDTVFVHNISRTRFLTLVGAYKKGTHLAKKYEKIIKNQKLDSIDLWFDKPANVSVDGEIISVKELHITLARNALRILIPDGSKMIGSWNPNGVPVVIGDDKT